MQAEYCEKQLKKYTDNDWDDWDDERANTEGFMYSLQAEADRLREIINKILFIKKEEILKSLDGEAENNEN